MKNRKLSHLAFKSSTAFLLLLLLSGLSYFNELPYSSKKETNIPKLNKQIIHSYKAYVSDSGMQSVSNFKIDVRLIPERKLIKVIEELIWTNSTKYSASEVQFHLYPNAFSNNKTVFMRGKNIDDFDTSGIKFTLAEVNNRPAEFIYFQPEVLNKNDHSVGKIKLSQEALPGTAVKFKFCYEVPIPSGIKRFGYASGRNFFFISQWYVKPGVFENGKWICSQYHPYTNFFSDFGKYDVRINVPETYVVGSTGGITEPAEKEKGRSIYHVVQDSIHDFAWMASEEIIRFNDVYKRSNGSIVEIYSYIQPENIKYRTRFADAIKKSLKFLEEYVGIYPYKNINLVDVPRTSFAGGMEYPTLITVGAELFSPIHTHQPEYVTVHEFCHQYFYGILANNEVYEAWLDEGLTNYIASKIMKKYYGDQLISFHLFNYYPVIGLNFLSYNEIPLIYSLGKFKYPEGSLSLARYIKVPQLYAITDTSYLLPDGFIYGNASYSKPELALLSLERYLSFGKMMNIFRDYYSEYKFRHPTGKDFIKVIQDNSEEDLSWFFENIFYGSSVFDYKIKYVSPTTEKNTYEVYIERIGDGIFKQDVALYTEKDTLFRKWDGKERWKVLTFKTTDKVIGAEIDPFRKNILDLDYANNSYFIKYQYGGSFGLTFRWFFWMQNLLLILGSLA